jgi:hypothetical protein
MLNMGPLKMILVVETRLRCGCVLLATPVDLREIPECEMRELTSMTTFYRFNIKVVAGVGLCSAAVALSPGVAAASLRTGGYSCVQGAAGAGVCVPPAPAGAAAAGIGGAPAAAPVPAGAPVPGGAPVPAGAPVPVVPAGAPLIALGGAGAPVPGAVLTGGPGLGGKGAPIGPAPASGPVPGQPLLPGPPPE